MSVHLDEGVRVFGSALVHVPPDRATVRLAVSRLEPDPSTAFEAARSGAAGVSSALRGRGLRDVRSSRVSLSQERRFHDGRPEFLGYTATISFEIVVEELDEVEAVVIAAVDAGANLVRSIDFTTTRLREVREQARTEAVNAARRKAEVYAGAVGVELGRVCSIVDVSPDRLTGRSEGHATPSTPDAVHGPLEPGAITVGGAVWLTFTLA